MRTLCEDQNVAQSMNRPGFMQNLSSLPPFARQRLRHSQVEHADLTSSVVILGPITSETITRHRNQWKSLERASKIYDGATQRLEDRARHKHRRNLLAGGMATPAAGGRAFTLSRANDTILSSSEDEDNDSQDDEDYADDGSGYNVHSVPESVMGIQRQATNDSSEPPIPFTPNQESRREPDIDSVLSQSSRATSEQQQQQRRPSRVKAPFSLRNASSLPPQVEGQSTSGEGQIITSNPKSFVKAKSRLRQLVRGEPSSKRRLSRAASGEFYANNDGPDDNESETSYVTARTRPLDLTSTMSSNNWFAQADRQHDLGGGEEQGDHDDDGDGQQNGARRNKFGKSSVHPRYNSYNQPLRLSRTETQEHYPTNNQLTLQSTVPEDFRYNHHNNSHTHNENHTNIIMPVISAAESLQRLISHDDKKNSENNQVRFAEQQKPPKSAKVKHGPELEEFRPRSIAGDATVAKSLETIRSNHYRRKRLEHKIVKLFGSEDKNGEYRFLGARKGEVIWVERMLILSLLVEGRPPDDFSQYSICNTRIFRRWKEHNVVARFTGNEEVPVVLQFYRAYSIPLKQDPHISRRISASIGIGRDDTRINLYSGLDKTNAIWSSKAPTQKHGDIKFSKVYLLKCGTMTESASFYAFIHHMLGSHLRNNIVVQVPETNVVLDMGISWTKFRSLYLGQNSQTHSRKGNELPLGSGSEIIIDSCRKALRENSPFSNVFKYWESHARFGLAWKRYDRLEWVNDFNDRFVNAGLAMSLTHDLELRPECHYPTTVKDSTGMTLNQPMPIEGFILYPLSVKIGKIFAKRMYLSSHENMLLIISPRAANPPMSWKGGGDTAVTIDEGIITRAYAHQVRPFQSMGGVITWLADNLGKELIKKYDRAAFAEYFRRSQQPVDAESFINLCEVDKVRSLGRSHRGRRNGGNDNSNGNDDGPAVMPMLNVEETIITEQSDEEMLSQVEDIMSFEIVMKNGSTIKYEAFNEDMRDEWVKRLNDLVKYWSFRTHQDISATYRNKIKNLHNLRVDECMEGRVGATESKWQAAFGEADPLLYNVCDMSYCRPMLMKGTLFYKPSIINYFTECLVILCQNHLVIYQKNARGHSGVIVPSYKHKKREVLNLAETYVYSGAVTEFDMLKNRDQYSRNMMGQDALPRIYQDGTRWADESFMRTFVLWVGKKRLHVMKREQQDEGNGHNIAHSKHVENRLGVNGSRFFFMAQSRIERDRWVTALSEQIGRYQFLYNDEPMSRTIH